jgi:flavin reductase (DIM6/NTAB) family NADH-FMN oxidoreductase RutF
LNVSADEFRSVLGRFASGVTVVTTRGPDETDQGMTVSAFCSVSLDPPLVLICIEKNASVHRALTASDRFVVNILSVDQEQLARRFSIVDIERFEGVGYSRSQHGIAILDDVLGVVECTRHATHDGGDHTIIVGEVEAAHVTAGSPLLYYRGGYSQLDR